MMRVFSRVIIFALTAVCLSCCAPSQPDVVKDTPAAPEAPAETKTRDESGEATGGVPELDKTGNPRKAPPFQKYRRAVVKEIASHFDAEKAEGDPDVNVVIARDGKLISAEIAEKSDAVSDEEALKAIRASKFRPLPEWVEGDSTEFRIKFRRVRQIKSQL